MEFCDECDSYIDKIVENGKIMLRCSSCSYTKHGNKYDSLFYQQKIENSTDLSIYDTFLNNAPFGPNKRVYKKCNDCGLDYQTKSILGDNCTIIYRCKCQRITSEKDIYNEFNKKINYLSSEEENESDDEIEKIEENEENE